MCPETLTSGTVQEPGYRKQKTKNYLRFFLLLDKKLSSPLENANLDEEDSRSFRTRNISVASFFVSLMLFASEAKGLTAPA